MKKKLWLKLVSLLLVLSTLLTVLPSTVLADEADASELYIKDVQLVCAENGEEARTILEEEGYIFLDSNLNEGTGKDGIWMGYTTTTDPMEAIYDIKLMNMNGGFTLTSMAEALAAQESVFTEMATDLNYLIEEFVEAYEEGSVPAQTAYQALNFFRMVDGETELAEHNGLGYQIVNGGMTVSKLTEMLLLCDSSLVDSIIKILTTGIQVRSGNWMAKLSELGPYNSETVYYDDEFEAEFKRRANQLLPVLQLYSQAYNAMDLSGLIPSQLNENFEPEYDGTESRENLSAEDAAVKKLDESRYKLYKVVFDELDTYSYGTHETLKDFFCSLENEGTAKDLYPLVSILSDGEFAALSYGCFMEIATGASATEEDFASYDDIYKSITQETKSVYLYHGVKDIMFEDDTVIGFTEAATRHMAATGELEFYEKESLAEDVWETGKNVATIVGCTGAAIMGVAKITAGISMTIMGIATAAGAAASKTAILAGIIKISSALGGPYAMAIVALSVIRVVLYSFIISVIIEEINGKIDWDANPMPEYLYDVKEVSLSQTSVNDGIATEYLKKPVFALYEAVTDRDGNVIDLNARSTDASQWIAMYVSRDRQGAEAKPIKADGFLVQTGHGDTPEGYVPLTRFGEVIACDLNQWDEDDDVNGVYVFYRQDPSVAVDDNKTYYIYDVYLQTGESDSHCIELLKAAGFTPLNVNLSPSLTDDDILFKDRIYTYLGFKTTTSKSSAIRDIRIAYGPSQGQIQMGAATYAECGSNGHVTLYATKYATAGTPLLAGGLLCVEDRSQAPEGHEPVCSMAGGPALSLNVKKDNKLYSDQQQLFLYFLPETTFTSGKQYIGDLAYFYSGASNSLMSSLLLGQPAPQAALDYWDGYVHIGGIMGGYVNTVTYYPTYNPYRAIYDVKVALRKDPSPTFAFEGVSYVECNKISWVYTNFLDALDYKIEDIIVAYNHIAPAKGQLNGTLYLAGNPKSGNVHKASSGTDETDPGNTMTSVQPLSVSDLVCITKSATSDTELWQPSQLNGHMPLSDIFSTSSDPALLTDSKSPYQYEFYIAKETTDNPYISNIYAVDALTLCRANGGYTSGVYPSAISETMLLAQLAGKGATNFCGKHITLAHSADGTTARKVNSIKFAYKRTADAALALRDLFLYFDGFSTDDPPSELYRGTIKYTLVCEIPYNLTGYDEAPGLGIYLYGTTNKKAGNPITEFDVSAIPFMDGYRTVRTNNDRSIWSEAYDDLRAHYNAHPMQTGKNLYNSLTSYLNAYGLTSEHNNKMTNYFYLHFKKEGDELRKQEPYVEKLYLAGCALDSWNTPYKALETLFDQGADTYVDLDLNKGASDTHRIYLGYSYTDDPDEAIRGIWAYHEKSHGKTLTGDNGITYDLVDEIDLNEDAFGDYIWLYATKDPAAGNPVTKLSAGYNVVTGTNNITWVNGEEMTSTTACVKRWGTDAYSDLNRKAGGKYIYLMFDSVDSNYRGTATTPNYGADKLYSRSDYANKAADGQYIGGLYVMDKNTILQEKIAAGTLPAGSKCSRITNTEVFDRLKAMGATTVLETPIQVTGDAYFEENTNQVFIGYSRTNTLRKAIRSIVLKADILSPNDPPEKIESGGYYYTLVTEPAKNVKELPHAINMISIDHGHGLLIPRLYLYYSTTADSEPICDITIDSIPIKNGWLTAKSANGKDAFTDISEQAAAQKDLAHADYTAGTSALNDTNHYNVYSSQLYNWAKDLSNYFDPEENDLTPFYIHTKHYSNTTLEQLKPYISEVFVAEGDTEHIALSKLVQHGVDGYIECNLNWEAGGNHVYLGYKRTANGGNALMDLVVFEGKNPDQTKRLEINGKSVKYSLVANVDLNSSAGGKWLYLYASNSADTGNRITDLRVEQSVFSSHKCGVEQVTTKRADGKLITNENIDLNKSAGGKTIYLIMTRQAPGGHDHLKLSRISDVPATCGAAGALTWHYYCLDCGAPEPKVIEVYPATGQHTDAENDGDHKCDVCGAKNITKHIPGEVQQENMKKPTCSAQGSYHAVVYCVECEDELRNTVLAIDIDPNNHKDSKDPDHNCDLCGAVNIEDHTPGRPKEENRIAPTQDTAGSYIERIYCAECNEKLSERTVKIPALSESASNGEELAASLFAEGSVVIIGAFLGLAAVTAIILFLKKKKKQ